MVNKLLVGKKKLEGYGSGLEVKVKERTKEVVLKMKKIEKVNAHQELYKIYNSKDSYLIKEMKKARIFKAIALKPRW